jgi:hypothetical protein
MSTREACSRRSSSTRDDVLSFQGRGGQTFDYIEDETVMDRLDEVLGVGTWSIAVEPISVADGIVKVRLSGRRPRARRSATRTSATRPATEGSRSRRPSATASGAADGSSASADTCTASTFHKLVAGPPPRASQSPRPVSPPAPVGASNPDYDEPPFPGAETVPTILADPRDGFYGDQCPKHHVAWKEGKYGPYCSAKDPEGNERGYCIWKPNKRWAAEHELDLAAR